MIRSFPLLVKILNGQLTILDLDESQWSLVVRQARHSMLLAYLYYKYEAKDQLDSIPDSVVKHLHSAKVHADKQCNDLKWEIRFIEKIAKGLGYPLILLKGSAYAITQHPISKGRVFSDIDLMVDKKNINSVEKQLMINGWLPAKQNDYDQRYYRQWMHEIPPLIHLFRKSVVDLHHNILPPTTKSSPDAEKLLTQTTNIDGIEYLKVFSIEDRIIHSATHLFYDGDFNHGLRDLIDIDGLINHCDKNKLEITLIPRCLELGLERPVFYALHYTKIILDTDLPENLIHLSNIGKPNPIIIRIMDFLFIRALMPNHQSCDTLLTGVARWVLYVRSHSLRMPLNLLLPHLYKKSISKYISKN